jgi:hypothetical protein
MSANTESPHHTDEDFLEVDQPVPGQSYVCLSFVSPEKTLLNKEQWMFYNYNQYVISEYNKIFQTLTEKMLESGDDTVPVTSVVDLMKRMKRVFDVNQVEYEKWKELVDDFRFRESDTLGRKFDEQNNFQTSVRGVKVRGTYDTYREAEIRSKVLQRMDSRFDVFIGQVGYWLPWHPDVNKIQDQEYINDELNTLVKEYKNNEAKRDIFYKDQVQQRKSEADEQTKRMKAQLAAEKEAAKQAVATQLAAEKDAATESAPTTLEESVSSLQESVSSLQEMDPWMVRKLAEKTDKPE